MSKKTKKGKAKKKNAEKAFCSAVAKIMKLNRGLLFVNNGLFNHYYKQVKNSAENAVIYLDRIQGDKSIFLDIPYFRPNESETISFFKSGSRIIKIEIMEKYVYHITKVKKVSFVKPTLLFEEVSYKQAKKNNTIDFQLAKWISECK